MPVSLSGSLLITGSITTSGTITAQTLVVQTITSSIVNMTGSNIFGSRSTDRQTFTGSMFVTGSGTFTSTISAIGESTLFRGAYNDPVPNTVAVLKMSSTPTPSLLSTVVGARMSGSATANFDSYAGYFSNIALSSGNGMSYGIFATASFHTFIGETRFAQGVFNDPINGTAASVKISATPRSGAPTAVFTVGITGAASSGQNTFAGYFTNTSTVSGGGVNYGIYATGSSHYLGGSVGIGTLTPTSLLEVQANQNAQTGIRVKNTTSGTSAGVEFGAYTNSGNGGFGKYSTGNTPYKNIAAASTYVYNGASGDIALLNDVAAGNISFAAGSASTAQMFISASGNVGIGTTTPGYKLHVGDLANTSAVWNDIFVTGDRVNNDGYYARIVFGNSSQSGGSTASIRAERKTSNFGTELTFYTNDAGSGGNGSERMRITSAGLVGVGTTDIDSQFKIFSNSASNLMLSTTSKAAVNIVAQKQTVGYSPLQIDAENIQLLISNSEKMRITSAGNVGFNTTSPTGSRATNLVQVAGSLAVLRVGPWFSTDDRDFVEIQADGANTRLYSPNEDFSFHNPVGNANITGSNVNLCATGNINFRTTAGGSNTLNVYAANAGGANAALYLECAGAFGAGFFSDRASGQLRGWSASSTAGVSLASNGTSWGSYSDERMKDIIEPITNAIDKISTLRTVIGKYKTDEDDRRRPFLIAQDVQAILPEAVYDDKSEDKFLSLSYTDVIPLLVASIKELTAKVTALENK